MNSDDVSDVASIANETLAEPQISWRSAPLGSADVAKWIGTGSGRKFMVSVAEQHAEICGFATLGAFKPEQGFEQTKELSIYVSRSQGGKGIGKALMAHCLMPREGIRRIMSLIDASNTISVGLHERFGFAHVGYFDGVGFVCGQPRDLFVMMHSFEN